MGPFRLAGLSRLLTLSVSELAELARGLSVVDSGLYTSVPFFVATAADIVVDWLGDRLMSVHAMRSGLRRYLVALCLFLTATGLVIPYVRSLTVIIILVSITVSFVNAGPAANATLTSDLLRSPADAGRAFAFLVLGGNVFGLLSPIVTGYLVAAAAASAAHSWQPVSWHLLAWWCR